jgi:hypothetical protein
MGRARVKHTNNCRFTPKVDNLTSIRPRCPCTGTMYSAGANRLSVGVEANLSSRVQCPTPPQKRISFLSISRMPSRSLLPAVFVYSRFMSVVRYQSLNRPTVELLCIVSIKLCRKLFHIKLAVFNCYIYRAGCFLII